MNHFSPAFASQVREAEIASQAAQLERDGYLIIRSAAEASLIEHLNQTTRQRFEQTPFSKGNFYGEYTKRFGQVLTRAPASAELVQHRERCCQTKCTCW